MKTNPYEPSIVESETQSAEAWRDGDLVVVSASGVFPARCVFCNRESTEHIVIQVPRRQQIPVMLQLVEIVLYLTLYRTSDIRVSVPSRSVEDRPSLSQQHVPFCISLCSEASLVLLVHDWRHYCDLRPPCSLGFARVMRILRRAPAIGTDFGRPLLRTSTRFCWMHPEALPFAFGRFKSTCCFAHSWGLLVPRSH